jgi:hypothetical protein
MHKNENTQNSHSFLALAFFRGICLGQHQRIWNQHKILRYFDTHIDIFQEKNCLGHNSTFCNLKMQMRKKLYIFKNFAKSKKLFFCQYLSFSVWFPLSLKHWSPLLYIQYMPTRKGTPKLSLYDYVCVSRLRLENGRWWGDTVTAFG